MKRVRVVALVVLLVLVVALVFVACTPSKDAVRAKYENAGYNNVPISAHTLGLSSEAVEYVFRAERSASEDGETAEAAIEIVLFVDETEARDYADIVAAENADAIEAGTYVVALEGKFVLCGSPEAVELF